ncbi:MAG: DUF349 domain-containing protein [Bacteroidales bacterium]|nr:DUF349 domain-containing protein [Bacteroidales bacterium]
MSEDLKPIAPEVENTAEEQSATVSENAAAQPVVESENVVEETVEQAPETVLDYANKGLKELVDIFQSLVDKADVQQLYKHAEGLKAAFYKTLKKEKIASGFQAPETTVAAEPAEPAAEPAEGDEVDAVADAPAVEEPVSQNPFAEIERGFKDLFNKYKTMRNDYTAELNKVKEENYEVKSKLIGELKELVDNTTDINKAYPAFREIQNKWRSAGPVPAAKAKDLYETYNHYVEVFYDNVKINRELRELDFKKNLEAKEELCKKAEALAEDENPVGAFRTLQKLHEEWKEFGPVDKEYRESIWERFKAATAVINKKHQAYFESQKGNQKANLEAKEALCEKVEAIAETEITDSNTWNALSKEIENIQKEWKTIGFASKKDNQKIYDRFRAACDKFYATKRDFYSDFKSQMQENMEKKINLCEQAEALAESEDWKKTSDLLIDLQKQWKEIGPVSRKKSEQIWKRFRAACDKFFDSRDKHFGDQDSQYAENLAAKQALVAEINAYESAGAEADAEALKGFQARWAGIGFVPFKEKEKLQKAYSSAIAAKFGDVRAEGRGSRFPRRGGERRQAASAKPMSEKDRLIAKFLQMEQDIQTWENNMGFFSKSKNAEQLLKELQAKIDSAKEELAGLEQRIKALETANTNTEE